MIRILKKAIRALQWIYFKRSYAKDKWHFILIYGIGDAYMVSSLLPTFTTIHGDVQLIFSKKNQRFIPSLFNCSADILVHENFPLKLIDEFSSFKKGSPIILNPNNMYQGVLISTIGYKGITLMDTYKILLKLDLSTLPAKPSFKDDYTAEVEAFFKKNDLPLGKTVILCPSANSVDLLSEEFWTSLSILMQKNGFKTIVLGTEIPGIPCLNFPLEQSISICEAAGHVISLRSGFCDLIATSNAKKVILYPKKNWCQSYLIHSTNLVDNLLTDSHPNLLEIEVYPKNENQKNSHLIDQITKFIYD